MCSKLKNLRMVILTLSRALPSCINVIALGLFFFVIYGVLGVQLFAGTFYSCNDDTVNSVHVKPPAPDPPVACAGFEGLIGLVSN